MPKEPLFPHIPKSRQPQFPHVPGGRQPGMKLPASRYEFFPKSARRKLPPIGATGDQKDPIVQVKFFTPWTNWTWYAMEFDGNDIFFGWVVGLEKEFGPFSLSELQSIRGPAGLKIERDIYFEPKPISQVMKEHGETLAMTIPKSTAYKIFRVSEAKGASGEVHIARETTGYVEEEGQHPALPRGVTYPAVYTEVMAVIDDVGHVTYTYFPSVRVGHIEGVNVEVPYRRRGFGRKLLQFAIDDMREKGISKVSASILSKEGASLLKALGFAFVNDLMERSI